MEHPCVNCGACCAFFRVAFYWREGASKTGDHGVPPHLWEEASDFQRVMKGTAVKHRPQCAALKGIIGRRAFCTIYENRSSTCKKFEASYENGYKNQRCDEARAAHGLRPLIKEDFKEWREAGANKEPAV